MTGKVLVCGLGGVGGPAMEFLARSPGIVELIGADAREDWGLYRTEVVRNGAALQGFYPQIEFRKLDLFDVDTTTSLLKEEKPDVIINTTTLQSWWEIFRLPEEVLRKIHVARYGPWLPMHLTLTYKLMQAVKKSGIKTHVLNASFPSVTNPTLGKVGLAPTSGFGNLDLSVPPIQKYVSEKLKVPMRSVDVWTVQAHFMIMEVLTYKTTAGKPFYLKVLVDGKEVTEQLGGPEKLYLDAGRDMHSNPPGTMLTQESVAASGVKNAVAIINDLNLRTHAPGPNGLPGGYPVRFNAKGVEVVLPEGLSMEEAIKMNEEMNEGDGIEKIEDDGTVIFTDKATGVFREMLGYDHKEIKIDEMEIRAKELREKYQRWAKKI